MYRNSPCASYSPRRREAVFLVLLKPTEHRSVDTCLSPCGVSTRNRGDFERWLVLGCRRLIVECVGGSSSVSRPRHDQDRDADQSLAYAIRTKHFGRAAIANNAKTCETRRSKCANRNVRTNLSHCGHLATYAAIHSTPGRVAKLADAQDLKSCGG
jgi:hypothetical protein